VEREGGKDGGEGREVEWRRDREMRKRGEGWWQWEMRKRREGGGGEKEHAAYVEVVVACDWRRVWERGSMMWTPRRIDERAAINF